MKKTLYDGEHFQVVLESKKPLVKGVKTDLHKMAGVMLAAGAAWLLIKKHLIEEPFNWPRLVERFLRSADLFRMLRKTVAGPFKQNNQRHLIERQLTNC